MKIFWNWRAIVNAMELFALKWLISHDMNLTSHFHISLKILNLSAGKINTWGYRPVPEALLISTVLHHWDKIPEISNFIWEGIDLGLSFRGLSVDSWPCCFQPVAVPSIMVAAYGRGGLFTSWQPGCKEKSKMGPGFWYSLQGHTPNDLTSSRRSHPWKVPLLSHKG